MFRNSYVNLPTKIAVARVVFWAAFVASGVIGVATGYGKPGYSISPAVYALTPFWVGAWIYLRVLRKRVREMLALDAYAGLPHDNVAAGAQTDERARVTGTDERPGAE